MFRAVRRFLGQVQAATSLRGYDMREELILWDFRRAESLKEWSCIGDHDLGGYSSVALVPNGKETGIKFHGHLNTEPPPGMTPRYSGYCAIRSKPRKEEWLASGRIDTSGHDALQVCVRGDGRRFIANLSAPGMARKDDVWQCFVFTRGGPEWENIVLPFSEFVLTNRGYLQDHQIVFPQATMSTFGLLLVDKVVGPFELEIQSIKAIRRLSTREERYLAKS